MPTILRTRAMQLCHDHPAAGHRGSANTLDQLQRYFFWPQMSSSVSEFIRSCESCSRNQTKRHAAYGLLRPLPIPGRKWGSVSMDFIVQLPPSADCTNIAVVCCRLTKMAHFLPLKTIDARTVADAFFHNVVRLHGLPDDITTDRDPVFTSDFWRTLTTALSIDLKLSTAFHPQTDGQTERTNQSLEEYLRHFVNYTQDDWTTHLSMAEFSFNNMRNASTKMSPFFALSGCHPRLTFPLLPTPSDSPLWSCDMAALSKQLTSNLRVAQERMAISANRRRAPAPNFAVGDLVYLSTTNLRTTRPAAKLAERRIGPFRILKLVSPVSAQLDLPKTYRIHDVFHVSLLEPHVVPSDSDREHLRPPPDLVDNEPEFEVEAVLDSKIVRRRLFYLIRWRGYGPSQDSWEPAPLSHALDLLQEFHARYPKKSGPSVGEGVVLRAAALNFPLARLDLNPGLLRRSPPPPRSDLSRSDGERISSSLITSHPECYPSNKPTSVLCSAPWSPSSRYESTSNIISDPQRDGAGRSWTSPPPSYLRMPSLAHPLLYSPRLPGVDQPNRP